MDHCNTSRYTQVERQISAGPAADFAGFLRAFERLDHSVEFVRRHGYAHTSHHGGGTHVYTPTTTCGTQAARLQGSHQWGPPQAARHWPQAFPGLLHPTAPSAHHHPKRHPVEWRGPRCQQHRRRRVDAPQCMQAIETTDGFVAAAQGGQGLLGVCRGTAWGAAATDAQPQH